MANFMKLNARTEQRIGEYATRLLRVEAHLRRGEKRAAAARLQGFLEEIETFKREIQFPLEMTVVGAQLGLLSGKGSWMRGRLPGALLGGVAGWMFGQSQASSYRRYLEEIAQRVALIEHALEADAAQSAQSDTPQAESA